MPEQPSKNLFKSKTFWTNVGLVAGGAALNYTGTQVDTETALAIGGIVNIILRAFTKQPVHVTPQTNRY